MTEVEWPRLSRTLVPRKIDKRLWLVCLENGERVYTPPSFIRLINRWQLAELGQAMTQEEVETGRYPIGAIMRFERDAKRV